MLSNVKAVIFDMDGVIFDSEEIYYKACFVAAEKNNIKLTSEMVKAFSGNGSVACKLMLQNYVDNDLELAEKVWNDWARARIDILIKDGLPFKPGFLELLNYLKDDRKLEIALVTSADIHTLRENFAKNNGTATLERFSHIITVEDVTHPKPNPEPYLLAMSLLNLQPHECIVIEDSNAGVSAALGAGAKTIMINGISPADISVLDKLFFKAETHKQILEFLS